MKYFLLLLALLVSVNGCVPVSPGKLPTRSLERNHVKAVRKYHHRQVEHRAMR